MSGSSATRICELRDSASLCEWREKLPGSARVGFVPTMGALHEGHGSLVAEALKKCDFVLVSIFVNPLQFDEIHDLEAYPRTETEDCQLLQTWGAHGVYLPTASDMYPEGDIQQEQAGPVGEILEGAFRHGHFSGMLTVVRRLFERVKPQEAFFGQKDAQQLFLVRAMSERLKMGIEVQSCSTVRESDGLAMSSRNQRLLPGDREKAGTIFQALTAAQKAVLLGEGNPSVLEEGICSALFQGGLEVEYAKVVAEKTFLAPDPDSEVRAVVAVRIGDIRLIDNMLLGVLP